MVELFVGLIIVLRGSVANFQVINHLRIYLLPHVLPVMDPKFIFEFLLLPVDHFFYLIFYNW